MKNIWGVNISYGMNILEIISHEEDKNKAKANFERVKNGEKFIIEEEYGSDDLFRTVWKDQYFPIIENKNIIGIGVIIEDLTFKLKQEKYIEDIEIFRNVISLISNGVVISDATKENLPVIFANKHFTELTGYTFEDIKGRNMNLLQCDDREQKAIKIMKDAIIEQKPCEVELRNYKKDGTLFYNRVSLSPIFDESRKLIYYVGIQSDITNEYNQNRLIQKAFDVQKDIAFITDGTELYLINQAFKDFYGVNSVNDFKTKYKSCICSMFKKDSRFFSFDKINSDESWLDVIQRLDEQERKVLIVTPQNIEYIFNISVTKFDDTKYIVSMVDISNSLFEKFDLKNKLNYDTLTTAFTREFFNQNISSIIQNTKENNKNLGIAMMDIDHFKNINDSFGHDFGDIVLKGVVSEIKDRIRSDDFIIRWGGEEFLILIPTTNIKEFKKIIENLRISIENIKFEKLKVTASFGITLFDTTEIFKSIKNADIALYEAKKTGRNRVCIKD